MLNEATKIISHAELLKLRGDRNTRHGDSIRVIHHSGEEIATFIELIRTILDASDHEPSLVRTDVREILETEIETCRNVHPSVSITLHGPDTGIAMGGE